MKKIDKIALLYWRDGKILSTLSKGKALYYLPGGKREGQESDLETLIREIKEELSVDLVADSAQYYGTFTAHADGKADHIQVQMTCYTGEFVGDLHPANEIAEIVWLTYGDLHKVSEVDRLIFHDLHEKGLL